MIQMLGYSQDLALVLVALAIRSGAMDVTTLVHSVGDPSGIQLIQFISLKMSIGTKDSRTNGPFSGILLPSVPGLFDYQAHNRCEFFSLLESTERLTVSHRRDRWLHGV